MLEPLKIDAEYRVLQSKLVNRYREMVRVLAIDPEW